MKYNKHITIGYKPDGTRIRKWFHSNSKADLEEQIFQFKLEQTKAANPSDITFESYADRWMKTYKCNCGKRTQEMYESAKKRCSGLNPYEIRKITRSMCQEIINDHWDSPRTAEITAGFLKQIFRCAIQDGIMAANPADALKLPKKEKNEKYLLTEEEMEASREADLNDSDRLFLDILMIFGLRPGEALALQKRDFDLKTGMLHITKAVEISQDGSAKIKSTKTTVSRDIPIPDAFRERVRSIPAGFWLFTRKDGQLVNKSSYRCLSERILKAINSKLWEKKDPDGEVKIRVNLIPEVTLYSFRHRRATDLYYITQNGTGALSTKQAAALMGHSEEVFIRTYSHIDSTKEDLQVIYKDMVI
ncbi:MAG: tyrosine-type recombinase/integrase [Parasporobacterium sp.]|nr:tyrosine-type recombinase/integrase [Parasporobacterium sp.]